MHEQQARENARRYVKNDEFRLKNEAVLVKNDDFLLVNDGFPNQNVMIYASRYTKQDRRAKTNAGEESGGYAPGQFSLEES